MNVGHNNYHYRISVLQGRFDLWKEVWVFHKFSGRFTFTSQALSGLIMAKPSFTLLLFPFHSHPSCLWQTLSGVCVRMLGGYFIFPLPSNVLSFVGCTHYNHLGFPQNGSGTSVLFNLTRGFITSKIYNTQSIKYFIF